MKHTYLLDRWLGLVEMLATTSKLRFTHHGMRRIVEDVQWQVPGLEWDTGIPLTFEQLGYKNNTSKMKQLSRNYYNEEAILAANKKLRTRVEKGAAQTSVAVMMGAGKKSHLSMGFCMQSLVASHTKDGIRLVMFYRSTEVIQKFLADLKFLQEFILPKLLEGIDTDSVISVRFHFVNAYVSAMFFPVIYQFEDPVSFLVPIEKRDRSFWRRAAVNLARMYREDTVYRFRVHQTMFDFYQTLDINHAKVKKYLQSHDLVGDKIKLNQKEQEDDYNSSD